MEKFYEQMKQINYSQELLWTFLVMTMCGLAMVGLALRFSILLSFALLSTLKSLLMNISTMLTRLKAKWHSRWPAEQPALLLAPWEE